MTGPVMDPVAALLAREAIRELLAEYCFRLDGYRLEELGALFEPGGEWVSRNGAASGPDGIAAFMGRLVPPPGPGTRRKHLTTNIVVALDGPVSDGQTARVTSNFLVVRDAAGPVLAVAGTYRDVVARQNGSWLFRRRELFHDIAGDSGLNLVDGR